MASIMWNYSNGLSPSSAGRKELASLMNQYRQTLRMSRDKSAVEAMLSSLPKVNKSRSRDSENENLAGVSDMALYRLVPRKLARRYAELMLKIDTSATTPSTIRESLLKDIQKARSAGQDKQVLTTDWPASLDILA